MAAVPTLLVNDPESYRAWLSVLVPGAVLFAGLQVISAREVARARASFRLVLGLAATLQLAFYVQVAGLANLASPTYVATHHTDVLFWENVGSQVLANPTNASVVYCTGFALAVAERAARRHRRFWWVLALVSGLAIFCTGSRGAALTAGLTLLAAALFHSRTRMRAILTVVVSGILFTAVNYWLANISAGARTGESLAARMEARLATLPVIADHPLGQGPGRTAEVLTGQLGHVSFIGDTIDGATSHDLFLNWAVGIGWLGLTLLLAAFAIAVSRTLHAYPGVRMLALIPLAAFLFSAQSTGLDVLNGTNAAWSATMFVLLGLCWRGAVFRRVDTHVTPVSRPRALQPGSLPGRRQ